VNEELVKNLGGNKVDFPPRYTGYFTYDGGMLKLGLVKKPSWFHKWIMKMCFGIEYETRKD